MMRLHALCMRLKKSGLLHGDVGGFDEDLKIYHLANDSRKVEPSGLFFAVRGVESDGHMFIDKAVQNGAIAVVCEAMPEDRETRFPGVAFVHVSNSRAALAECGAAYYGDPSHEMSVVGITGTNGKTTVSFLLHHVLTDLGSKAGLMGTIEVRVGEDVIEAKLTTPDALEIQRLLRTMSDAGCLSCAMEASSHALDQERARGIRFAAAIFTNLTRDHIDYHGTIDAYLGAKKKLFDALAPDAVAVYNADDAAGATMVADTRARKVSYGLTSRAGYSADIVDNKVDGLRLRIGQRTLTSRFVGRFNAYNLLAAYATAVELGYAEEDVLAALSEAPAVPGRFELIRASDGTIVIVDYAHTPDALENVLKTILETKSDGADLWCVFGCGGDRDREKRPMMGRAAERYADHVIITSDNPRTEDPEAIITDIRSGLHHKEWAREIVDRREAIEFVAEAAHPGDVVLIAGKGHETYQIIGERKRPFDDREIAKQAFLIRTAEKSDIDE